MSKSHTLTSTLIAAILMVATTVTYGQTTLNIEHLSTYHTGVFDEGAAEIAAFDSGSDRLFFVNADANSVTILDLSDPGAPTMVGDIAMDAYGGGVNSVDVYDGLVAAAVQADEFDGNGSVVFMDTDGNVLGTVEVGVLPDAIAFSPDGSTVVTANEGQPAEDYSSDPEGSISIIDISGGVASATVANATFEDFNEGGSREAELPDDIRIFGPGSTVAQDLEPEYSTFSPDGSKVYTTLQENNGLAIVDVATATVDAIVALGWKDHNLPANQFDASNRDDALNMRNWNVWGMYQPDAIATIEMNGGVYLVTANEGDARDYDGFSEEARVADLTLDPDVYSDTTLQEDENLGRLLTTTTMGDTDGDGDVDQIFAYGARSFSIWMASTGQLIYDSGSTLERITAQHYPSDFNSNNDENGSFDARSDDKGPEPEAVEVGQVGDNLYLFVGLERVGGVAIFNINDPSSPEYVTYFNNRDFSVDFDPDTVTPEEIEAVGDLGPEDITFISAENSPTGVPLIVVANEVSGSISTFALAESEPLRLTILHNNDGESKLVDLGGSESDFGGVARFKTLLDNLKAEAVGKVDGMQTDVVFVSSGDNFLAGPELNAGTQDGVPYLDTKALDMLGYDAIALGNHDFDFGPDFLAEFLSGFENPVPYLSSNLDFSGEPGLQTYVDDGIIAKSTIVEKGGVQIGIIGAITPNLPFITSPREVVVDEDVAGAVQAEIDALTDAGVNHIILISHLQGIEEDIELATQLDGVDVMVAGGGDELLANAGDVLIPGNTPDPEFPYPSYATDANGKGIPVVTTTGQYAYVGRLVVDFDSDGNLIAVRPESGPVRVAGGSEPDAVDPDPTMQTDVVDPVVAGIEELANNVIANSAVGLNGVREDIRSVETNQGNLIADAYRYTATTLAADFGEEAPDVGMTNGGGIRNDNIIPAGDISELNTFEMVPFGNFVSIVPDVPHSQFKELLENAVSRVEGGSGTGRWAQISGFSFVYDRTKQAQEVDNDGNVLTPGERIISATLDDGTVVIADGEVSTPNETISIATNAFVAGGGDQWPFRGIDFTPVGVTDQQAVFNFIVEELGGAITAADYPEGGEGRITESVGTATEGEAELPSDLTLRANYPNPFNPSTTIAFGLPAAGQVTVDVFDVTGKLVSRVLDTQRAAGWHQVSFNASGLPSGTYLYRITAAGQVKTSKMLLVK